MIGEGAGEADILYLLKIRNISGQRVEEEEENADRSANPQQRDGKSEDEEEKPVGNHETTDRKSVV